MNAPSNQESADWRDEIEVTPKMVEAGETVLAELEGEVSRSILAKEVFLAVEGFAAHPMRNKIVHMHQVAEKALAILGNSPY